MMMIPCTVHVSVCLHVVVSKVLQSEYTSNVSAGKGRSLSGIIRAIAQVAVGIISFAASINELMSFENW